MELIGKIIAVLPERGGISQRTGSEWKVGTYVLETQDERFSRKMVFEVFGTDKIQQYNIQVGETVRVSFDIDAHEYNGRWFNSIRAWNVDRNVTVGAMPGQPDLTPFGAPMGQPMAQPMPQAPLPTEPPMMQDGGNDQLPF